ncbi:MAG: RNA polymerase sigma factor [Alphaproteobacteria bacterium]|nr:RNA polymerase sigma factor [Alphaproteobacteria bacterium]
MTEPIGDQLIVLLPRLRRFARGLAKNVSDADDLVQAACERALGRAHQWQPGTRFDSWMFRIVQTIWIDQMRARAVRGESDAIDPELQPTDETVRRAEARMSLQAVQKAVVRLPEEQRAVLMLVTVEGLSYKEAADALGVPIGTVMSRLARARAAVQSMTGLSAGGHGGVDATV